MMVFLIVWSAVAFTWWGIALWLLADARRWKNIATPSQRRSITVFKSLPPVHDERELAALASAIGSFARELSPQDELLIGINALHAARWEPAAKQWRSAVKQARIEILVQPMPTQCANPKIAWHQVLAEKAKGELWLWSDADVTAPVGCLDALAAELAGSNSNAVTAPYCIQEIRSRQGAFDALFVNVEFLPGTLLLGRLRRKDFAYGAATLFRAETFRQRVDWRELGAALADDHKLGELLQPVLLAHTMVSTFTQPASWSAAWQHYYRWQKTVRWCQPGGFAALLVLMPVLGWSLAGVFGAMGHTQLAGLGVVLLGEIMAGLAACRLVGCRVPVWPLLGVMLWPLARPLAWLLVWLPLPVLWSGRQQKWFAPVDRQRDEG